MLNWTLMILKEKTESINVPTVVLNIFWMMSVIKKRYQFYYNEFKLLKSNLLPQKFLVRIFGVELGLFLDINWLLGA